MHGEQGRCANIWVQRHQQSTFAHRAWHRDIRLLVIVDIGLKGIVVGQRIGLIANVDDLAGAQVVVGTPDLWDHHSSLDTLGWLHLKCNLVSSVSGTGNVEGLLTPFAAPNTGSLLLLAQPANLLPPLVADLADRFDRRKSVHVHKGGLGNPNGAEDMCPVVTCGALQRLGRMV